MRTTKKLFKDSSEPQQVTNYYGLTKAEWEALSPDQRVVHYNRQKVCDHPASLFSWPVELHEQYSHDPYFNTSHLLPHSVELFRKGLCECQTCSGKFGIPRDSESRKVKVEALRDRLNAAVVLEDE